MQLTFVPEIDAPNQIELLKQLILVLEKEKRQGVANNLQDYIQKRNNYIKTDNGKYVQIFDKGIKLLDITELTIEDLKSDKYEGLLLKVGNEVEVKSHSLASWTYNPPTTTPMVNIVISHPNLPSDANVNVLLDTGCNTTTLSDQVLTQILQHIPNYPVILAGTYVVGGTAIVQQGALDITFANRKYSQIVNYTQLPHMGLLGTDILNSGVLTLGTGTNANMAFVPTLVRFFRPNLQHIFDRHKVDWGFAPTATWNTTTVEPTLITNISNLMNTTPSTVYAGTYRRIPAWLIVENTPSIGLGHLCAIVYRDSNDTNNYYKIWSGWRLSDDQYNYVINPPNNLGGGALLLYADVLEKISQSDQYNIDDFIDFFDKYKSDKSRYDPIVKLSLSSFFAILDNYLPENSPLRETATPAHILDYNEVKNQATDLLSLLEKSF